ncbi:MAG: RluA family pseudouridine synthase [Labilithrix sp.]|nr:RluA family pseudouridine synthase [Labilithrix sp.]MCW5812722.1 RluA family pseudouridine synthase [Labilithrix sp.]
MAAAKYPPNGLKAPKEVGPEHDGALVDGVVRALFELSWGRARELVRRGKVTLDGRVITQETVRVRAGATLAIDLARQDPRAARAALEEGALVFVDAHVVVVDKPAGVSTVPYDPDGMGASIALRAKAGEEATLDQRVRTALAKRERARGRGGPPPEIGIVHRLDKETSGLLVFTRSWQAKKALTQAFRAHAIHRRYLALVHGVPEEGTIVSHFVEDRGDGLRGSVEHRRGRKHAVGAEKTQRAVTHVEVLERFDGDGDAPSALVACTLETGRTHQIRIHLAEAGHPLLGERVYVRGWGGAPIPSPRVMLHAAELGFAHPATNEEMRWTSEPPADMKEMLAYVSRRRSST